MVRRDRPRAAAASKASQRAIGACALNGKLYVVGGYSVNAVVPWLSRVDIYDPATDTWAPGPPLPVSPGLYQLGIAAVGLPLVQAIGD